MLRIRESATDHLEHDEISTDSFQGAHFNQSLTERQDDPDLTKS
jgi:hypothetical protein